MPRNCSTRATLPPRWRAPSVVLPFSRLLEYLPGPPTPAQLARGLFVSERQVRRWIADDRCPYPVTLALYYQTELGRGEIATELHNEAVRFRSYSTALERQLAKCELALALALARARPGPAANDEINYPLPPAAFAA